MMIGRARVGKNPTAHKVSTLTNDAVSLRVELTAVIDSPVALPPSALLVEHDDC